MPDKRSVRYCLENLPECTEDAKKRLRSGGFLEGDEITDMGKRFLSGEWSTKDAEELQAKINSWYCYGYTRRVAKSPIDCGCR